ncbi:MAG: ATP synthase F1 subunit gamma [Firmicutes bacterium]|nr:ATP synthase F1 subunit gamma [Bacillota bacterium]
MSSMREIKRRIRAISNIQHVTGAMKMVAAAKLRRAQGQVWAARPYAQKTAEVAGRLARAPNARQLPLVAPREVKKRCNLLVVGDRGLAGAYNANVIHVAHASLLKADQPTSLIIVGRKGVQFFRRRKVEILQYYVETGDEPDLALAREIARNLMEIFLNGQVDEVGLIYSRFYSALRHVPQVETLLPVEAPAVETVETVDYLYEPEPVKVLEAILPRYCEMKVYQALLEAKASELGARMVAMDAATKNSGEVIEKLTLSFNKARQSAITTELLEVASGAEAMKAQG